MKKAFSELTKEDYEQFPVWEVVDIANVKPYAGDFPIKPDNLSVFQVRTKIILADKTELTGETIISSPDETEVIAPAIFTNAGRVEFTVSANRSDQKDLDELTGRLGKPLSKIFPLQFETDVPIQGGPRKGTMTGFLFPYRYENTDGELQRADITFLTALELRSAIKRIKDEETAKRKSQKLSKAENALLAAAESGKAAEVEELIAKGVKVNRGGKFERNHYTSKGVTALMLAAEKGHIGIMRALLDGGAEVDRAIESDEPGQNGKTALGYACFAEKLEAARLLLGAGADLNRKLAYGQSIFDDVCTKHSIEMIRFLIASGAKIGAAIIKAVKANRPEAVKLLIEYKADVNAADSSGKTVLMEASSRLSSGMVNMLLNAGADVTLSKSDKCTALHMAVSSAQRLDPERDVNKIPGAMEVIKALVEKGADVNAPDTSGETPLRLAKSTSCKLPELADYLGSKA